MKTNKLLVLLVGTPISLIAILLSFAAFCLAIEGMTHEPVMGLFCLLGIAGLWAVYSGNRNLLRFEVAHLHLHWHDWVGGISGATINLASIGWILYCLLTEGLPKQSQTDNLMIAGLFVASGSALVCFAIVLCRYIKHRKS